MTRRERMTRRLERRQEWAQGAKQAATERFARADSAVRGIEPGQPILVGHHSEKHHRAALERCDSNMRAGFERSDMAKRHEQVADTLEQRLETTVFSDDSDAVQQLEARITEREAQATRIKVLNAAIRKEHKAGLPEGWLTRIGATEAEQRSIRNNVQYDWRHEPMFPGYVLTNLRGRITADRERLKSIKAQQARQAEAEAAGGVVVVRYPEHNHCRVTFAEKPERTIIDSLKAAGFYWGSGSWSGPLAKLPEGIA